MHRGAAQHQEGNAVSFAQHVPKNGRLPRLLPGRQVPGHRRMRTPASAQGVGHVPAQSSRRCRAHGPQVWRQLRGTCRIFYPLIFLMLTSARFLICHFV